MRQRILNNREQPVELHLAGGVAVIPPLGELEVDVDEAGERHLEHMAAELRVTVMPVGHDAEDASGGESPPVLATARKAAGKRSR